MTSVLSAYRAPDAPASVRLDELSVYSLQRLVTLLVAANTAAAEAAPDDQLAAELMGDIVLENLCPAALRVRQVGSGLVTTIESNSTRYIRSSTCLYTFSELR